MIDFSNPGAEGFIASGSVDHLSKRMRDKATNRKIATEKIRDITPEYVAAVAVSVTRVLLALPEMASASAVALYHAMIGEIDLEKVFQELNRQEKETLLPRYNQAAGVYEMVPVSDWRAETCKGHYGIREPLPDKPAAAQGVLNSETTLWCVPGLAFDTEGRRLGRGGGYYDRLLARAAGTKVGVAYDRQIFSSLPVEPHDTLMDIIVTERRCLRPDHRHAA